MPLGGCTRQVHLLELCVAPHRQRMRRARTRLECPRAVSAIGAITLARVMVRYKGEQRQLVRGRRLMRRNRCSEGGGE